MFHSSFKRKILRSTSCNNKAVIEKIQTQHLDVFVYSATSEDSNEAQLKDLLRNLII